jgi:alpha-L-fucosidase 2
MYLTQDYIGGNPPGPVYTALPGIRDTIWQTQINNGTQQRAQVILFSVT